MVKGIAFTAYPAADVAGLVNFYEDFLGVKAQGKYEEEGALLYGEFPVGNTGWFSVMTTKWASVPAGGGAGVAFEVDDIEKTLSAAREKGLKTEDIYDTPVCRIGSLTDPEGNKVTLHQTTKPH